MKTHGFQNEIFQNNDAISQDTQNINCYPKQDAETEMHVTLTPGPKSERIKENKISKH